MRFNYLLLAFTLLFGAKAFSYEFSSQKIFIKGVMGPSVNFIRYDKTPQDTTPGAGLMLGVEAEYVLDRPWSLTSGVRPVFAPGFLDLGFGFGGKYRWDGFDVPLNVSVAIEITPAFLIPFSDVKGHFNLGLRASGGVDYFLMNNLVVGAQVALEPSVLLTSPFESFETSIECLLSVMYKI